MKAMVKVYAMVVIATMTALTVYASFKEPIWGIPSIVTDDAWFKATLFDAYFGFLTFYGWVFYKERSAISRTFWLIFILLGGNLAMSSYILCKIWKLPDNAEFADLLLRSNDSALTSPTL